MLTIRFLYETLNFGDVAIRKLCTFKDVSIKGEFKFREFDRHFKTDSVFFTKRRCKIRLQYRWCFAHQLVQAKERRVYGSVGYVDKETKSRC